MEDPARAQRLRLFATEGLLDAGRPGDAVRAFRKELEGCAALKRSPYLQLRCLDGLAHEVDNAPAPVHVMPPRNIKPR